MFMAKFIRCLMASVFTVVGSAVAFGEIIVYDGFNKSVYGISSAAHACLNGYPTAYDATMVGLTSKKWQMNGTQPQVWGYGLNFPAGFEEAGITARGEWSIGPNSGGSNTAGRTTVRELATGTLMRTSGSLYFRVLMHLDSTGASMLPSTSDTVIASDGSKAINYWGVGFSPATGTDYTTLTGQNGAFGFFFRKNKAGVVSVIFYGKGSNGTVLEQELCAVPATLAGISDANTYIAYAKIDLNASGAETIYAGAQPIGSYDAAMAMDELSTSIGELELFAASAYPKGLVYDGCYLTNGKVFFDEIGVATEASDLIVSTPSVPLDPDNWEYSFGITLGDEMKTAIGSGDERDFPVLVRLSESGITGFKYSDFSEADYSDLVFVDADGKFLDYEVDTWDAGGTSLVWVKIPSLTADTQITCRYGGPSYKHTPAKTWSAYIGVWHMNEASGNAVDSTGHGLDGVPTGFNTALMVGEATAPTGKGRVNQKASGAGTGSSNRLSIPSYNNYITDHSKFTLSGWFKSTDKAGYPRPLSRKTSYNDTSGWEIQYDSDSATSVSARGSDGKSVVTMKNGPDSTAGWLNLAFVFNGTSETSYGNGGEVTQSGTIAAVKKRDDPMAIGNNSNGSERGWCGMYDEVRMYNGVASAARVKADYLVVKNSNAMTYGTVVMPDPELPKIGAFTATVNADGNIVIAGTVLRHAAEVTVTLDSEGRTPIVIEFGEIAADGTFEKTVGEDDGLFKLAAYTVSVEAANGDKVAEKTLPDEIVYGKTEPGDYLYKFTVTPSETIKTFLGSDTYENFPVLVRIPAEASAVLNSGSEVMVRDETEAELSWDMETVNQDGTSFLWVKVPTLSASTALTVYVGGMDNVDNAPADVWSRYVGVWHFAADCKDSTVPDATGHGLDGVSTGVFSAYDGPWGNDTIFSTTSVQAPDYENLLSDVSVFTASGWFKLPNYQGGSGNYANFISKKTGLTWNEDKGWYVQMNQSKTTAGLVCAGNETKYTALADVTANWHFFQVVADGTTVKVYFDGKSNADISATYKVKKSGTTLSMGAANSAVDEYRVRKGAASAKETQLEYKTMADEAFFVYSEVAQSDPNAPVLNRPEIRPVGDGTFMVSETITENMPAEGSVKLWYNGQMSVMTTSDVEVPATYVTTITAETPDVTEVVEIRAKSEAGTTRILTSSGFYNGELKIEKICDASEKGLSNGTWRITRADASHNLDVALVVLDSSTATAGVDYVEFPLSAVIADGTNSVDVMVTPLMNLERAYDTWVDLAITNGAYRIDEMKFSARCMILNYEIPTDANIWTGQTSSKASVGSNWTQGVAPNEFSVVMFDGDVSQKDCEWDIDATHMVKSWLQKENYTGTVTLGTTFDDTFQKLEIDGDMLVLGGRVCHKPHDSSHKVDFYRLSLNVGGMLSIGKGALISARALGSYGLRAEGRAVYGGSYNGARAWGSLTEPSAVGASGFDNNSYVAWGGGAIWIEARGTVSVNGSINANGILGIDVYANRPSGSGGSIYIKCPKLVGSGRITALSEAGPLSDAKALSASGGRISVLLTESEPEFPVSGFNARSAYPQYDCHAGAGTVLVRSPGNPNGLLYLLDAADKYNNSYSRRFASLNNTLTDIPEGQTWTLDGIVFGDNALLRIPYGTTLNLVRGLTSVSSVAVDYNCGIIVDEGTLMVPLMDHVMSGKWTLTSRNEIDETVIKGNLTVKDGANIGSVILRADRVDNGDTLPLYGKCRLTITGDLSVNEGATLNARRCGLKKYGNSLNSGHKGVLQGHTHGGRVYAYKSKDSLLRMYTAYDSVFSPSLPGNAVPWPNGQGAEESGGVITLNIGGHFQMDGKADVGGNLETYIAGGNCSGGTGGSIDITASSISGRGSFRAEGGVKQEVSGPGGRIAIKLTGEAADFSAFKGSISASGRVNGTNAERWSSSGTIFMKTGNDTAKGGTIRIAMSSGNCNFTNPSSTELLSIGCGGDDASDYKELGVELTNFGFGAVNVDLDMSWVNFMDRRSRLDLEGNVLTVRRAWVCGSKVPVGTYESGDEPFGELLTDSEGGGMLRVTGCGIWVFIQ